MNSKFQKTIPSNPGLHIVPFISPFIQDVSVNGLASSSKKSETKNAIKFREFYSKRPHHMGLS